MAFWQSIGNKMTELSLNVLDIANNSIRAGAGLVEIDIEIHRDLDALSITITDNGSGMTSEQLMQVRDPFYTTRTTRRIGLGIPFFQMAAHINLKKSNLRLIPECFVRFSVIFH
ncbi:MAG: hypothetical protein K0R00_3554 [Herbinix sp.]|nr:hypothetical protein [Herbinix sp.]